MKKNLQSKMNESAIQEIKSAMSATKDARMYQRYQTILLHLQGLTYDQISAIVNRTPTTIGFHVRAYKSSGLVGLELDHSPGRPARLTEEQEKEIYQLVVEKTPVDVGFPVEMNWTAPILRDWIRQKYGFTYTDRGIREILYRLGFSYTKPTYSLKNADPEKQETFKKIFETLKKTNKPRN